LEANLDDGIIALMIPIFALAIPIVVVLTNHQRKMAEIIHQTHANNNVQPVAELEAIRMELQNMRMQMNQHTIALDDLRTQQQQLPPSMPQTVQERLGAG
jgi:hypothetical protein